MNGTELNIVSILSFSLLIELISKFPFNMNIDIQIWDGI